MMKLSNFRLMAREDGYELAAVDETTGWGPWKKVVIHKVFRGPHSSLWRFLDTGELTPGLDVEKLAEAAKATEVLKDYTGNSTIDAHP